MWCPKRGPSTIVATTNVVFGTRCPYAKTLFPGLLPDIAKEVFLVSAPPPLTLEEVSSSPDLRVLGTWEDKYSDSFSEPRTVCPSQLFDILNHTNEKNLATVHLNLVDSLALLSIPLPSNASTQERTHDPLVPRSLHEALSPEFVDVWGPAMDLELQGFQKYQCFQPVPIPAQGMRTIPGHWIFFR